MQKGPFIVGSDVSVLFNDNDAEKSPASFISERFRAFNPSHESCTLIGSTSMYLNKAFTGPHHVCDAFHVKEPNFASDYLLLTQSAAVSDGLGYSEDDEQFNLSLAKAASAVSLSFVNTPQKSQPTLLQNKQLCSDIVRLSHAEIPTRLQQKYKPECSLSAGTLTGDHNQWLGNFVNVGDGMIVIVDKTTLKPKHVLPATVVHRTRGNYSPQSVQELSKTDDANGMQHLQCDLAEDDLIIYMTDGIYSGFKLNVENSAEVEESWSESFPLRRLIRVNNNAFDDALAHLRGKENIAALDVAIALLQFQASNFLQEYHHQSLLLQKVTAHTDKEPALQRLNLEDFLLYLKDCDLPLQTELSEYLAASGQHDGVTFILDKSLVGDFISVLTKQEYGDCATICVTKVPSYNKELIKAYLDTKNPYILDIINKVMRPEEAAQVIEMMRNDKFSPAPMLQDGVMLRDLNVSAQYRPSALDDLANQLKDSYSGKGHSRWNKLNYNLVTAFPRLRIGRSEAGSSSDHAMQNTSSVELDLDKKAKPKDPKDPKDPKYPKY